MLHCTIDDYNLSSDLETKVHPLSKKMKNIISCLLSLFQSNDVQPQPGLRVNYAPYGHVEKCDGTVVACDHARGVLVAWPRGGADWLPKHLLSVIH